MIKSKYIIVFIALLIVGMSVAVAADVDDSTSTPAKKVTKDTTKVVKNSAVTKKSIKAADTKTTSKAKESTKQVANKTDEQKVKKNITKKIESKTKVEDVRVNASSINKKVENNNNDDISTVKEDTLNLSKKIIKNVKNDGEVTVVKEWQVSGGFYDENNNWEYVEFTETFATLYSNGTLIVDVNEHVLYPNGPYGGSGEYFDLADRPWKVLNQWAGEYTVKDIILNERYPNYYSGAIGGGGLLGVGYDNSNEEYPNLMNVDTYTVNCYVQDPDFSYDPSFIDHTPFKHMTINNLVGGTGVNYNPKIFGRNMGVSPNIETLTFNNFEYTNTKGLWIENVPEVNFINSKITLKSNMTIKNSTVNFIKSELNIEYETDDETYTPTDYAINVDGNLTIDKSDVTIKNYKGIKLGSNINITNSFIESRDADYTIEIEGSNNVIENNTLHAKQLKGDLSLLVSGEDNVVSGNSPKAVGLTIIAADNINLNEEVPITIILKDPEGKLLSDEDVIITVGDSNPEIVTVTNGIYVYYLTPTQSGTLIFNVTYEDSNYYNRNTTIKEIFVNEDKDAIIEELNKTVQEQNQTITSNEEEIDELNEIIDEQDTQIETLENTTQTLNNTVSQLEEDLTQAQEQLANNNNTNSNGTNSNNGTSNTNTTTTPTKTSITIKLKPTTIYTGSKTKITATLKDANGKAVASQKISIKVGTKTYTVKTNKKGVATKTVKVTKTGKNKVTATFKATKKYAKATKSATLTVKAKEKTKITVSKLTYKNKKITIKATIKAGKKALTQNTKLTIKVDGKTLTSKKISKKGKISLTLKKALKNGSHKIQIISKATSMYKQAKITKTLKISA